MVKIDWSATETIMPGYAGLGGVEGMVGSDTAPQRMQEFGRRASDVGVPKAYVSMVFTKENAEMVGQTAILAYGVWQQGQNAGEALAMVNRGIILDDDEMILASVEVASFVGGQLAAEFALGRLTGGCIVGLFRGGY